MGKRILDLCFAWAIGVLLLGPGLLIWVYVALRTRSSGIYRQSRIGQWGKPFYILKFKTYLHNGNAQSIPHDLQLLRQYKIDEWPQLINILCGHMSVVGPRPDVAGYYDQLQGEARQLLALKPGLTSTASLKYWDEETLLALQSDPEAYNNQVVFPDKIQLNQDYLQHKSVFLDLIIIGQTIVLLIKKLLHVNG